MDMPIFTENAGRAAGMAAMSLSALFVATIQSPAADVRVFTSGATSALQEVVAAKFSAASGHRVVFTAGTLNQIRDELAGAARPDVIVMPSAALDALEQAGQLRSGSRINLARVGIGVAIRAGAPAPDVSTIDGLRNALLNARSIAHPDPNGGGFAGVQIARLFARMGIDEAVKTKVKLMYAFTGGVANIASGEAEIGLFNISEIVSVKGVALAGPLPRELQSYITFAGALHVHAAAPEQAAAYLKALSDPLARAIWRNGGFEAFGEQLDGSTEK